MVSYLSCLRTTYVFVKIELAKFCLSSFDFDSSISFDAIHHLIVQYPLIVGVFFMYVFDLISCIVVIKNV